MLPLLILNGAQIFGKVIKVLRASIHRGHRRLRFPALNHGHCRVVCRSDILKNHRVCQQIVVEQEVGVYVSVLRPGGYGSGGPVSGLAEGGAGRGRSDRAVFAVSVQIIVMGGNRTVGEDQLGGG